MWGIDDKIEIPFNKAYWLAQPPEVQALQLISNQSNGDGTDDPLTAQAKKLAQQGFLIDLPIMVWRWDPIGAMIVRKNDGFSWTPSAFMAAGGGTGPVPPGAFKVSTNPTDFPPFNPPAPPVPVSVSPIGNFTGAAPIPYLIPGTAVAIMMDVYSALKGVVGHEGMEYEDATGSYWLHFMGTQMGAQRGQGYAVWLKPSAQ